ncbi:MAG: hypothetical protein HY420_03895, partial [Candidatus Kerfeldbacteria bacterium]|nr:hypothetical protein [Candidatus Kerfeldbacteria bacterium]
RETKTLKEQEDLFRSQATGAVTGTDVEMLGKQVQEKQAEYLRAQTEVAKFRPPVPWEARLQLRNATNEKKKQLLTDQWEEHASVAEDGIEKKDATLVAAALLRAAEYSNENELLNHFGYDQNPQGLKKFIEEVLIKQMGMARDQALSVATDVSFIAEKRNHWDVGRLTSVDAATGRQIWNPEDTQQKTVTAETRKLDFERYIREGNRLAFGEEVVGLDEGLEFATPDQKKAFFRGGGGRGFRLLPHGEVFFMENFGKLMRNLRQGRFNPNLAIKLMSKSNEKIMNRIAERIRGVTQMDEKDPRTFDDFLSALRAYASSAGERGEFDDLDDILDERRRLGYIYR